MKKELLNLSGVIIVALLFGCKQETQQVAPPPAEPPATTKPDETKVAESPAGEYQMTLPAGFAYMVRIVDVGDGKRFRMAKINGNSGFILSGLYELKEDRLITTQIANGRESDMIWKADSANSFILVEPEDHEKGVGVSGYIGATLVRKGPATRPE